MNQTARIINMTVECTDEIDPNELKRKMTIIAGKAAGICYMPDNYLSEGVQNEEKAIKRAQGTAKSGHYSTYDHGHISFIFETDKMMAMILNSLKLYNTSEKSARYTMMVPETELEKEKYSKWKTQFVELVKAYYGRVYNEKEIEKLAMENARYMISVFTPTVLEYTVPYDRAILTVQWLRNFADGVDSLIEAGIGPYSLYSWFYSRVSSECRELADIIASKIGVNEKDEILHDHKNMGIEFFRIPNYISKLYGIPNTFDSNIYEYSIREDIYSDCYISNYNASFAEVAQAERHRTLSYTIDLPNKKLEVYIPKIIRGSAYEIEWKNDFEELVKNQIIPQGALLCVTETGRFEDFYLKCKERLCSRAQLEIMEVTRDQVVKFAEDSDNLCKMNQMLLGNMIRKGPNVNWKKPETVIVESRCKFSGYTCQEPCKIANDRINYYRNI